MYFRFAADAVLVVHLSFILFALLGGVLAMRWRWMVLIHLPAVAWAFFVEATAGVCPLTRIENEFRNKAGQSGYAESFIEHYLLGVIYPAGLTSDVQSLLAAVVVIVNIAIYAWLIFYRPTRLANNHEKKKDYGSALS